MNATLLLNDFCNNNEYTYHHNMRHLYNHMRRQHLRKYNSPNIKWRTMLHSYKTIKLPAHFADPFDDFVIRPGFTQLSLFKAIA